MHHDLSFSQDNNDHTIRLNLLQITVRVIAHQGAFMNFWHHKSILSKLPNCYKWLVCNDKYAGCDENHHF